MNKNINKTKLNRDLHFGLKSEELVIQKLQIRFGDLIKLDKYNNFDFKGDKIYIELKTRRINHNKYPSLMFSKRKLDKGLELYTDEGAEILFLFMCLDGLYGWYYINDDEISDNYEIKTGGRKDRGIVELEDMVHIKTRDLFKFEIADQ
jgi:hypothetical protein